MEKNKPKIVTEIEGLLGKELTEAPLHPDLLTGLITFTKDMPKYATEGGELVGLNLAATGLDDDRWQKIQSLLESKRVRLRALNISDNNIRNFGPPPGVEILEQLDIDDNPLDSPPPELVKQGPKAIIEFFRSQVVQGTDAIYEAKLLLLGLGGAGKTSLCRKLINPDQPLPKEDESTKGIDVHKLNFTMKNGKEFRMNIWDFGGQEIYHSTHQFFLNKRSLYVLLDDTRKDDRSAHDPNFRYWLQICELLGGDSPLLIVQNEKADRSKELDLSSIKGRFDFVTGSMATNLATGRGLDKVKDEIEHLISSLGHVGAPLPKQWAILRQEVEDLSNLKEYINEDDWLERCEKKGVDDAQAKQLSQYFHDIGVFLHFQDDDLLCRTVILKKEWATNAVYRVLDDETVKQQSKGRFTEADLQRIWHEPGYQRRSTELRALMEKFELCYEILDMKPRQWLVPQLLPPSQPKYDWSAIGNLSLRYRYDFMPKGLLSRIVVRLHRFIARPDMAWQRGVLFERLGASAEVMEAVEEKDTIRIRVQGNDPVLRKELRSIIAEEFDKLHATFENLKVEKLVPCICATCVNSPDPIFYEYSDLDTRRQKDKQTVECRKSYADVNVMELLEGIGHKLLETGKMDKGEVWGHGKGRTQIQDLIANNEVPRALELLQKSFDDSSATIMMANQWHQLRDDENKGILSYEVTTQRRNQIINSLLTMAENVK